MLRTQGNHRTPVMIRAVHDPEPVTPVAVGSTPIYGAKGSITAVSEGTGGSTFFPDATDVITFVLQQRSTIQITVEFVWTYSVNNPDPLPSGSGEAGIIFPPPPGTDYSSTSVDNPTAGFQGHVVMTESDGEESNVQDTGVFVGVATRDAGTYTLGIWGSVEPNDLGADLFYSVGIVVGANTENDDLQYPHDT